MLSFRVLGPFEVERDGTSVALSGQRQRDLLAGLLIRANHVVSTERLVDELWAGEPPRTATTSLHNTVSQLRRILGDDAIVTRAPGYLVSVQAESLDVARFERLVSEARAADTPESRARLLGEALDLWRGRAFEGIGESPAVDAEARRLDELRLMAVEERVDAELAQGRDAELVAGLEALVAAEPLRERLRGQLMLALYRSGRQADALQAYAATRRTLVDALAIEPGPALQRLHAEILRQDRSLVVSAPPPSAADQVAEVARMLLAGRLVAVVGPDVTTCGRPEGAEWSRELAAVAPSDRELAAHLTELYELTADAPLTRVAQQVFTLQGVGPLYDELHEVLGRPYPPGPVHRFLASLPARHRSAGFPHLLVVTTSLDETLERAFEEAGEPVDVVSYIPTGRDRGKFLHVAPDAEPRVVLEPNADSEIRPGERPVILRLNGRLDADPGRRDRGQFVVSEDDYIDYLAQGELASVVPVTLVAKLRRSHFLFLGYGPGDWHLRVFLRRVWGGDRLDYRSWAVDPAPDPVVRELWRSRGVEALDVPIEQFVDELGRAVDGATR